jgi:uncharacterized surface protein with fasciclin (FAS1) repeats
MKRWTLCLAAILATAGLAGAAGPGDSTAPPAEAQPAQKQDVIDTAAANKDYSRFIEALRAAALVEALKGKGPFTVFVPTNDAFAKLPTGTLESLLKPENKAALQNFLKYHIIPASVPTAELIKLRESSKTLQGSTFKIVAKAGKIKIGPDEKRMVNLVEGKVDIECINGGPDVPV